MHRFQNPHQIYNQGQQMNNPQGSGVIYNNNQGYQNYPNVQQPSQGFVVINGIQYPAELVNSLVNSLNQAQQVQQVPQYPQMQQVPQYPQRVPQQQVMNPTVNTSGYFQNRGSVYNQLPEEELSRFKDDFKAPVANPQMQQGSVIQQQPGEKRVQVINLSKHPYIPISNYNLKPKGKLNVNIHSSSELIKSAAELDTMIAADCEEELIETIIEEFHSNDSRGDIKILAAESIVRLSFYDASHCDTLKEMFKDDIKQVYACLNEVLEQIILEKEFILFNHIDDYFTKMINDYLFVNFGYGVAIDSFSDDLDDLYKSPIFDRGVNALTDFNHYLNSIVKGIREATSALDSSEDSEEGDDKDYTEENCIKTTFNMSGFVIYVDLISKAIWPVEYNGEFKKVTYDVGTNTEDIPLVFRLASKYLGKSKRCTLVTADRVVIDMMLDHTGALYMR